MYVIGVYLRLMNLISVVELPEFIRAAKSILSDADRHLLIDILSSGPQAGVPLGGGIRKLRFARSGSGKSGGFRVVYFYRAAIGKPLFLITIFAKNVKETLSPAELAQMIAATDALAASYGRRQ